MQEQTPEEIFHEYEVDYQHTGNPTEKNYQTNINRADSFTWQRPANANRESIVEHYRSLRQNQKDILSKINMRQDLKRQIFGFHESHYCSNEHEKNNLVTVLHPFRGRLILKEQEWKQMERATEEKRKNQRSTKNIGHPFSKEESREPKQGLKFEKQERQNEKKHSQMKKADRKSQPESKGESKENTNRDSQKNIMQLLLKPGQAFNTKMDKSAQRRKIEEIGEEIIGDKKSQISSIHDLEEENENNFAINSAEFLMRDKTSLNENDRGRN